MVRIGRHTLVRFGWALAGVAVLAAVVFGASALWPNSASNEPSAGPGEYLASKASAALESGDTTAAIGFAERALAVDASNAEAKQVLTAARKQDPVAEEPPTSSEQPDPVEPAPDDAFLEPLAEPRALLPSSFDGYAMGAPVVTADQVTVQGTATQEDATVTSIIWTIHDAGGARGATSFISKTSKVLYAKDAVMHQVDGASVYVGTDGTHYASAVYTRGRYVFEVLVSGIDGAPAGYRTRAIAASRAFGDSPTP